MDRGGVFFFFLGFFWVFFGFFSPYPLYQPRPGHHHRSCHRRTCRRALIKGQNRERKKKKIDSMSLASPWRAIPPPEASSGSARTSRGLPDRQEARNLRTTSKEKNIPHRYCCADLSVSLAANAAGFVEGYQSICYMGRKKKKTCQVGRACARGWRGDRMDVRGLFSWVIS